MLMAEGYATYPVCHRCGTNTQRCRYCVSYQGSSGACLNPNSGVDVVTDPDARTACPQFRSSLALEEPGEPSAERQPLGRPFWLATGLGTAVVVLVAVILIWRTTRPAADIEVFVTRVYIPTDCVQDRTFDVLMTLANRSSTRPAAVQIRLDRTVLQRFKLVEIAPLARQEQRGKAVYLTFPDKLPPNTSQDVTITFAPQTFGQLDFSLSVWAELGRLLGQWQEKIDVMP